MESQQSHGCTHSNNKAVRNTAEKKKSLSSNKEIWALCAPPKLPMIYHREDVGEAGEDFLLHSAEQ